MVTESKYRRVLVHGKDGIPFEAYSEANPAQKVLVVDTDGNPAVFYVTGKCQYKKGTTVKDTPLVLTLTDPFSKIYGRCAAVPTGYTIWLEVSPDGTNWYRIAKASGTSLDTTHEIPYVTTAHSIRIRTSYTTAVKAEIMVM